MTQQPQINPPASAAAVTTGGERDSLGDASTHAAGRVLVTGASGSVGSEVLDRLVRAGVPVRAVSRNPKTNAKWEEAGIQGANASLDDLAAALQGCDRMFLLSPATPDQYGQDRQAISAARKAGLNHVVKLSSGDAVADSPISWARGHAYSDRDLQASELNWTLLKPSAFYPNLLNNASTIRRGFLPHTSGHGTTGWIDWP